VRFSPVPCGHSEWGAIRIKLVLGPPGLQDVKSFLKRKPPKKETATGPLIHNHFSSGTRELSKDGKPVTAVTFRGPYHVRMSDASFRS
jgi:hypothetical protein